MQSLIKYSNDRRRSGTSNWQRRDGHRRFHLKSLCANDQQTWPQAKIFCWCYMQNGTRTASVRTRCTSLTKLHCIPEILDSSLIFLSLNLKHIWDTDIYMRIWIFQLLYQIVIFTNFWCWHNDNFLSIMLKTVSIIFYHQWWELCHNKQSNIISIQIFFNLKYFLWCTT